jgi:hypothetical protein
MAQPADVAAPARAQTLNKAIGGGSGAIGGGILGIALVAYIHSKYPNLSPEGAAGIASFIASAFAYVGAYLAPIATAAQQAVIRKFQHDN